jgi:hypothetical protein
MSLTLGMRGPWVVILIAVVGAWLSAGCVSNYNRDVLENSLSVYDDSLSRYNEEREKYFDLLENLEIVGEDKYLQGERRELKKEIEIRELELQNMKALIQEEVEQWERQVFERQQEDKVIQQATEEANQRIIKMRFQQAADELNPENYYKKKKAQDELKKRFKNKP